MLLGKHELPPLTTPACSNPLAVVFATRQTLQGVLTTRLGSRDEAMLSVCRFASLRSLGCLV
jgi:hypothetical protein